MEAFPSALVQPVMVYGDHAIDGEGHCHAAVGELETTFFKHPF